MREFQSRGTALARKHLRDWLILSFLIAMLFYRFIGKDMMSDLKYPDKPNTMPTWPIPVRLFFHKKL
jgi:diacylglycerol diphosphate phosphatase / phosphatidate phosphatase